VGERLPRLSFVANFGLAIDGQGNAWIGGATTSQDLAATTPNLGSFAGGLTDLYLAKLNTDGSQFTYTSYLGGGGLDLFTRLALDAQGNVHLTAYTNSRNFPTSNGLNKAFLGGEYDGYYCKVAADGSSILYGTYFGGQSDDYLISLAVTSSGEAILGGTTNSANFPVTADALDPGPARKAQPFLSALNAAGSQLISSGFFGGTDAASFADIQLDPEGNIYVSGLAEGPGFLRPHLKRRSIRFLCRQAPQAWCGLRRSRTRSIRLRLHAEPGHPRPVGRRRRRGRERANRARLRMVRLCESALGEPRRNAAAPRARHRLLQRRRRPRWRTGGAGADRRP
jgi:hypothetical protein